MSGLKIVVPVKQVPDVADLRIDPVTNNLIREGVPAVLNPPDYYAIEEAIELREKYGGEVIVITMGPPQAESALREAISMGADKAYLITDRMMAGADTWATSYTISKAIEKLGGANLLLFGRRATDGETEQVPPQTAVWLGLPFVGYVSEIREIDLDKKKAIVKRTTEFEEEVIEVPIPAAFSILEIANKPRIPDIKSLIRAKKVEIPKLTKDDIGAEPEKIGLKGSPTLVVRVSPPPKIRNPEVFDARSNPEEGAKWFLNKMLESLRSAYAELETYVKPQPKTKVEGEVWVYVDHIGPKPNHTSWEIMSEARKVADMLSTSLAAVIVGDELDELVEEAFEYGAERVYYARVKGFQRYNNEVYRRALKTLIKKYNPYVMFFPGTSSSRELAASTAIEVDTGLAADCTAFDVDNKGIVYAIRPDFGGKELSTIICPKKRPFMITVRSGVFSPLARVKGRKGELIVENIEDTNTRIKTLEYKPLEKRNILTESDIVVGVGRGIKKPENIKLAEELASVLGGVVGVSKPLADLGWYPKERQVGQTGTSIRPKLYIALGISGAIQHLVGIQGAKKIGAINIDPQAPIFENCDFGVVGDLFEIVPILIKELKELKESGKLA
ncbi:MAG: FAD-binding protein [Sulfolobaceae archaeon]|nr:FAD-binding protein [Sulfolobaceae archaeon]